MPSAPITEGRSRGCIRPSQSRSDDGQAHQIPHRWSGATIEDVGAPLHRCPRWPWRRHACDHGAQLRLRTQREDLGQFWAGLISGELAADPGHTSLPF